jgi:hypothetical protein
LVQVIVSVPTTVGVHVAFWGDDELLNVFTTGESPTAAEPEGVPVIVPVKLPLGVTGAVTVPLGATTVGVAMAV